MNLDIIIGYKIVNNKVVNLVRLKWDGDIGALIVARPGKGKSHLIAHMLTQYAIKGAKLAIAEYNAHNGANGQTLIERTEHLKGAFIKPPATTGNEIIDLIKWTKQELVNRQNGSERYPLVVVFDEFFQFAASVKPEESIRIKVEGDAKSDEGQIRTSQKMPTFWEDLLSSQTDLRKNNIRLIIAAQETSSAATSNLMRSIRDMFRIKLVLNLSAKGADLLGIMDRASQQLIDKLPTGRIYIDGRIIAVPYPLNPDWITASINKLGTATNYIKESNEQYHYDWTEDDVILYIEALKKYSVQINQRIAPVYIENKDDLIRYLIQLGKSNNWIIENVKGSARDLNPLIANIRNQTGIL